MRTLSEASRLRPWKMVRVFNSLMDIVSSNLAMHSSANRSYNTLMAEMIYLLYSFTLSEINAFISSHVVGMNIRGMAWVSASSK